MYLDNLEIQKAKKFNLANEIRYWQEQLFAICEKLFTWEGLPFKQKEIESNLILFGKVGIISLDSMMTAVKVSGGNGPTPYLDEWKFYNWTTFNGKSGRFTNNEDGILIDNNALRNPTFMIIQHYAVMLAHTELTLVSSLINGRSNKTIIASTQKMADSVRAYQDKIYNGTPDAIVDPSFIGLNTLDQGDGHNPLNFVKTVYDVRQALLYSFYEDLGIKKNQQKRERLVSDEVEADASLLKLNIKDMLDARLEGCEKVNALYGTSWSVKCNVDFDADGNIEEEVTADEV